MSRKTDSKQTYPGKKYLTLALVIDSLSNLSNGTANSANQLAAELTRLGHQVRLVGVQAPEPSYRAEELHLPVATALAHQQQECLAKPNKALFYRAFAGADIVHIYEPFIFGRAARDYAWSHSLPVTAGFHIQPENITYALGPLRHLPGLENLTYGIMNRYFYRGIRHLHVPSQAEARLLHRHGYHNQFHIISNGYQEIFHPASAESSADDSFADNSPAGGPLHRGSPTFLIAAAGRLSAEKDHATLLKAVSLCRYRRDMAVVIAGDGPLRRRLTRMAADIPDCLISFNFYPHESMPRFYQQADLLVHPSIADIEGVSVLEAMACGLVPVIASSPLSAAGSFALTARSLFPAGNARILADQLDWWFEHPHMLNLWGKRYAAAAAERYSLKECTAKFLSMEREAMADFNLTHSSSDLPR